MTEQENNMSPEEILSTIQEVKKQAEKTPGQRVRELMMAAAQMQISRQQKNWVNTHEHVDTIHTGKFKRRMKLHDGKPVINKFGMAEMEDYEVTVPVFQYVGYNYKKKYDGAALREIRRKQTMEALKRHADLGGEPLVEDRVIDSDAWNNPVKQKENA